MPLLPVRPIELQPSLTLESWSIRETLDAHERHFVGRAIETGVARISSAVVRWDPATMRGTTRSGRTYRLSGPPGFADDTEYAWRKWVFHNEIVGWRDITAEALRETAFAGTTAPVLVDAWTVMEHVLLATRYLVGYCCGTDEPLVVGPIRCFEAATRCVTTDDGLVYRLFGVQMLGSSEFELILERFQNTEEASWTDVGDEVSDAILDHDEPLERPADSQPTTGQSGVLP